MADNTVSLPIRQRAAYSAAIPLADCPPRSVRSLYVHVPFCNHKCHYCDFYSLVDLQDRQAAFIERLTHELQALAPFAGTLVSVFVGGGTPTLLLTEHWQALAHTLDQHFKLASDCEFTVECNPETAQPDLFRVLADAGVNRLSIGIQSFDQAMLDVLQRKHNPASVPRALELARAADIGRLSVDLIYAIPGQSVDSWRHDLDQALALGVDHISCYNLTYEPRTALTARLERGLVEPCPEDLEIEMFELTRSILAGADFERYEISNYARPGFACRHNLAYWRQDDWLAAGPSASGHAAGHRWKNTPHLDTYLTTSEHGFAPIVDHETPDFGRALREKIMTGLRLAEGLDRNLMMLQAENACPGAAAALDAELRSCINEGLLADDRSRLVLTERGILFADGVAGRLMATLL